MTDPISDFLTRLRNASKAKRELGWEATTKFDELVRLMVDSDLQLARSGQGAFHP